MPPDQSARLFEIRRLIDRGLYKQACQLQFDLSGQDGFMYPDYFVPAFDLTIHTEAEGEVRDYARSVDFQTGEIALATPEGYPLEEMSPAAVKGLFSGPAERIRPGPSPPESLNVLVVQPEVGADLLRLPRGDRGVRLFASDCALCFFGRTALDRGGRRHGDGLVNPFEPGADILALPFRFEMPFRPKANTVHRLDHFYRVLAYGSFR